MNLLQRTAFRFASFVMRFSGIGGGARGTGAYGSQFGRMIGAIPGSDWNFAREVGDPAQNSRVAAAVNWMADPTNSAAR